MIACGRLMRALPEGIHVGFAYNPGLAGFGRGSNAAALARFGHMEPLSVPGALSPKEYGALDLESSGYQMMPVAKNRDEAYQILRDVIGGDEAIFTDPTGGRVRVTQALVDHFWDNGDPAKMTRERFFGLIPDLIEDPAEIWLGFARSNVTKQVFLRRRYIKFIRLDKNRTLISHLLTTRNTLIWCNKTPFGEENSCKERPVLGAKPCNL